MNRDQRVKKVLEVIISKLYQRESPDSYIPEIHINDYDLELIGLNFHEFSVALRMLEELNVFERHYVSEPFKLIDGLEDEFDAHELGISPKQFRQPYLRFTLIVLGNPWKVYDELEKGISIDDISTDDLEFDSEQSILNVRGFGVKIARQADKAVEHFILKHIFDTAKDEQFSYTDFRQNEVYETGVASSTYMNACKTLNKKIKDSTNGKIEKFLLFGSSDDGSVQINPIYLD